MRLRKADASPAAVAFKNEVMECAQSHKDGMDTVEALAVLAQVAGQMIGAMQVTGHMPVEDSKEIAGRNMDLGAALIVEWAATLPTKGTA